MKTVAAYLAPALILVGVLLAGQLACVTGTEDTVRATVRDKERVHTKDSSYYLIFTDGETFKISDVLATGRFNSSDLYGRLQRGQTYDFRVYGFRVAFLSEYRNILDATLVTE